MSRTKKGSKGSGWEIWSRRADSKCSGFANGWWSKRVTSKYERRKAKKDVKQRLDE